MENLQYGKFLYRMIVGMLLVTIIPTVIDAPGCMVFWEVALYGIHHGVPTQN
jgi:hypothetical protein